MKKTFFSFNLSKSKRCAESITSRVLLSRHCPGISFARKQPPTAKRRYQDDSADLEDKIVIARKVNMRKMWDDGLNG